MNNSLSLFVKEMRKRFGLTQVDLAAKAGVGLRFVRELEQGKQTLRIDKVNQVLALFRYEVGAVPAGKEHRGKIYLNDIYLRGDADGRRKWFYLCL